MVDGLERAAGGDALEALRADAALQAAACLGQHLLGAETERHLLEGLHPFGRLAFGHGRAALLGQVLGDGAEITLRRSGHGRLHLFAGKIAVQGGRGPAARGHGPHHRGGAGDRVAGGVDAGKRGALVRVGVDEAALVHADPAAKALCLPAAHLTDGHKGAVEFQGEGLRALGHHRPGDAARVRLAGHGGHALDLPEHAALAAEGDHLGGVDQAHTLLDGLAHLLRVGRDVGRVEPADQAHLCAQAGQRPRQVKGRVAVADHRHAAGQAGEPLPLAAGEEGQAALDTVEILAIDAHAPVVPGAGGQEHAVVFPGEPVQVRGQVDSRIGGKNHAHALDQADLAVKDGAR